MSRADTHWYSLPPLALPLLQQLQAPRRQHSLPVLPGRIQLHQQRKLLILVLVLAWAVALQSVHLAAHLLRLELGAEHCALADHPSSRACPIEMASCSIPGKTALKYTGAEALLLLQPQLRPQLWSHKRHQRHCMRGM